MRKAGREVAKIVCLIGQAVTYQPDLVVTRPAELVRTVPVVFIFIGDPVGSGSGNDVSETGEVRLVN